MAVGGGPYPRDQHFGGISPPIRRLVPLAYPPWGVPPSIQYFRGDEYKSLRTGFGFEFVRSPRDLTALDDVRSFLPPLVWATKFCGASDRHCLWNHFTRNCLNGVIVSSISH